MPIETIGQDDGLLRRIPISPSYIKPDNSISSFAYTPRKIDIDGLSVDLEKLTTHEVAIQDRRKFRLGRLVAGVPISLGLTCRHSPLENNQAHSLIQGNFTKSIRKRLATAALLLNI